MPAAQNSRHQDPPRDQKLKRLLIRPGAIGDCILSLPALEHLRTDDTEVWVSSQNVPLIRFAHKVDSIAATGLDLVGFEGQARHTLERLQQFDSIVSWYGARRADFQQAVAHLNVEFHAALPGIGDVHATDYFARQVGLDDGQVPRLPIPRRPEPFAIFHPFSSSSRKNWPLSCFRELASRFPLPVKWCAGPDEDLEEAERIPNLFDLASWISTASIYVGNDSGISHLAAAAGVPVVAMFRSTDPAVWSPRGLQVCILQGDPTVSDALSVATRLLEANTN